MNTPPSESSTMSLRVVAQQCCSCIGEVASDNPILAITPCRQEFDGRKVLINVELAQFALGEIRDRLRHAIVLTRFHLECLLDHGNLVRPNVLSAEGDPTVFGTLCLRCCQRCGVLITRSMRGNHVAMGDAFRAAHRYMMANCEDSYGIRSGAVASQGHCIAKRVVGLGKRVLQCDHRGNRTRYPGEDRATVDSATIPPIAHGPHRPW